MTETILALENVSATESEGNGEILRSLNMIIRAREIFALVGMHNGERKALIDLICGLNEPSRGRLTFMNNEMHRLQESERNPFRGRMGIVNHPPLFMNNVRIMENLRLPLRYHAGMKGEAADRRILEIWRELGMKDLPDVIPSRLDTGLLGAAALVRALSVFPDLAVLERPAECLGEIPASKLGALLEKYVIHKGGAVLLLTAGTRWAAKLSHRVARFRDGTLSEVMEAASFRAALDEKETRPGENGPG
jgi:ABC-type ATPase involved in cell division